MRPSGRDYEALPIGDRAREWMANEDRRLTEFFEHQLGLAAADGGALMVPSHRLLTPAQWEAVRESVLGPGAERRRSSPARPAARGAASAEGC